MAGGKDIYVAFGADTGGLEAALALAKQNVTAMTRELNKLAKEMKTTGAAADSDLGARMKTAGAALAETKSQAKGFADQLRGTGAAAPELAHGVEQVTAAVSHGHTGIGFYLRELHALSDEFGSGRTRQGIGTLSNVIFTFLQSNTQWFPYAIAVGALGAAFGYVAYQAYETSKAVKGIEFDAAINQFTLTRAAAADLLASVERLGNVGASDAKDFIEPFLKLGPVGEAISAVASHYLPAFTAAGKDAKTAGEDMAKMFADVTKGGGEVIGNSRVLTEEEKRKAQAFVASGDTVGAYRYVLDILGRSFAGVTSEADRARGAHEQITAVMARGIGGVDEFGRATENLASAFSDATAKMQANEEEVGRWALKAAMATDQAGRLAAAMKDALKVDKTSADIKELEGKVKEFQDALGVAKDPASIAQLNRSLDIASDKLKKARQEFDAGLGGGDALSNLQRQFAIDDASFKGADADRLRQHDMALRLMLSSDALTAEQRKKIEEDLAVNSKAIRDAVNASYLRQEEIKVASAGKNGAAVVAIREAEVAREIAIYGAGSKEAEAAADRLARAKEKAAERGDKAAEKNAKDQLGAAREGYEAQIAEAKKTAEDDVKLIELRVKAHREGAKQGAAEIAAVYEQERAKVDDLYKRELALAGQTATQIAEIKRKMEVEDLTISDQIAMNAEKAAAASQKAYESMSNSILGAWNSQLRGMLSGQTSFAKAAKNVLADMVIQGIEGFEKLAANFILQQTVMNTAKTTGAALQAAADATAASGGVAAMIAAAVKAVTVDAGVTFGGVFANLAPIMGPAAAGPAAAAAATVAAAVPAADIGMWNVPQNQIALIHKGELVATPSQADAIRSLPGLVAGGGGSRNVSVSPSTHFHVNALDGASVGQWFRNNSREMMRAVDQAVRHGAHLGLRRIAPA